MISTADHRGALVARPKDRRGGSRIDANLNITFSPFNSRRSVVEFHTQTCNHSPSGACFEFSQPLHPGTVLFIRAEQMTGIDTATAALFRTTSLAEVKWCEKTESDARGSFRVGVGYY